jgi:hypothetical protein
MTLFVKLIGKDGKELQGKDPKRSCVGFLRGNSHATADGECHIFVIEGRKTFDYYNRQNSEYSNRAAELAVCYEFFLDWLRKGDLAFLFKDVLQKNGDLIFDLNKHSYLTVQTITSIWREPMKMQEALWTFKWLSDHQLYGYNIKGIKAYIWAVAVLPTLMFLDADEISTMYIKNKFSIFQMAIQGYWNSESPFGHLTYKKDLRGFSEELIKLLRHKHFWSMPTMRSRSYPDNMDVGKWTGLDSYINAKIPDSTPLVYNPNNRPHLINEMFEV